jgi:exopolysaccharide production protein ExoQ
MSYFATLVCVTGIVGLFALDWGRQAKSSPALWIPAVWLFLISSRPVSLWLGMTPSFANPTDIYLEGSPIDRAVFTALLVAALIVVISRVGRIVPLLQRNVPILLFFLFCAASIFWSDFPYVAFKRWIKSLADLLMILIILTEHDPMGALKRLIVRLGFILFPLSVLFIKYYPSLGRLMTGSWMNTFTGVTTQKNSLGLICMSYGIGFLWMFQAVCRRRADSGRSRALMAYGAILLTIVWLLKTCDSKTSIAGLTMAGGVMLLVNRPSFIRKSALVQGLVIAVVSLALVATFFDPGGGLVKELGRDSTLSGRRDIWNLVLSVPFNPWVGTGFESFWLGDRLAELRDAGFNFPINEAHNGFIEIYLNLGWLGVCLIALLLLTGYTKISATFRRNPERGSLFLGFFLVAIIESFTEAAFRMTSPSWILLLLAIIAASKAVPSKAPTRVRQKAAELEEPVWVAGRA